MLKKLAILSLWCWEDSKGFAKDAGGKIDIRSLLKQQTSRAESGIEQQEGNELWEVLTSFLAFETNRGRWKLICALLGTSEVGK